MYVYRSVEGSGAQDPDDRHTDCSAVVHLRHSQGGVPVAPPPSPRDARVPQEETAGQAAGTLISRPHPLCSVMYNISSILLIDSVLFIVMHPIHTHSDVHFIFVYA